MDLQKYVKQIDGFQRRHSFTAFPFAVVKKFGDDQGSDLAALIAYYGFLSLFPLLLSLFTILGFVLDGNPDLEESVRTSALANFPIIGDQLSTNVTSVRGSGIALAIGLAGAAYGGLGIANAAQNALNRVWEVPIKARPGFVPRMLRSLGVVGTIGVGIVVTTGLSGIGGGGGGDHGALGAAVRVGLILLALVLNVGLFVLAFRVLTARDIGWRDLIPGAIFAAVAWAVLQALGGFYVTRTLDGMSESYGLFAIVLGLLGWIFLQARVLVYAAEINVVRARHLWPRGLVREDLTEADRRAYVEYARTEERHPAEEIDVTLPHQTSE